MKSILCLNWSCPFSLSLLQVFLITLVQLVSKQFQRNSMNAWCFALPVAPPFNTQPRTWSWVFISDFNLPSKDPLEGSINNCWLAFFFKEGGIDKQYCCYVGIVIYFIQTQLNQITFAWLCMENVICFVFLLSLSPCIINKWHLDFIKVPSPL